MNKGETIKILDNYDFSSDLNEIVEDNEILTMNFVRNLLPDQDYDEEDDCYTTVDEIKNALYSLTDNELINYLNENYHVNFVKMNKLDIPVRCRDDSEIVYKYKE